MHISFGSSKLFFLYYVTILATGTQVCEHSAVQANDLFLMQRATSLTSIQPLAFDNDTAALAEEVPIAKDGQFNVVDIRLWVPIELFAFCLLGILLDTYVFVSDGLVKMIFLMMFLVVMNVGSYVGHAEIIKSQPRITEEHPFVMSIIENCSTFVFLPIGWYLNGSQQAKKIFWWTGLLAGIMLVRSWLVNSSLGHLSVTSFMIVYQISPIVLYVLQVMCLNDRFTYLKSIAVVSSLFGFAIILLNKKSSTDGIVETPLGYLFAVFNVLLFAVYQILLLRVLPDQGGSISNWVSYLTLFYGIRGGWSILLSAIGGQIYLWNGNSSGFGEFPNEDEAYAMVGGTLSLWIYLFVAVISWARFSPSWIAMSMSLQIPVSFIIDSSVNDFTMSFWTMFGTGIILAAFGLFTYAKHFGDSSNLPLQKES